MASKPTQQTGAVLSLLLAATLWGLLWYPLRLIQGGGLGGIWTTLTAYAAAFVPGVACAWSRRTELARNPWLLLALLLAAGWCNVSFIIAVLEGTVVRVVLLFYLSPVWTVLLGRIFLGERLSRLSLLVLALALSGAMLMLWDPAIGLPWPQNTADWLAISAGLAFSVSNVLVRAMQRVSIPVKTVTAWAGGVVVGLVWVSAAGNPPPQVGVGVWVAAVALGLFGIVVMTAATQYGVTHMPLHRSAVILLFELVVATASTQLLTDETMLAREWLGGLLIVGAALVSSRAAARES